jgi:hypothetical protein
VSGSKQQHKEEENVRMTTYHKAERRPKDGEHMGGGQDHGTGTGTGTSSALARVVTPERIKRS